MRGVLGDDLTAEHIQNDWRKADLTEAQRAMLEWAEKLTLTPSAMAQDDIQKLRKVGWTYRDILDITHVSAYFNYRVRMMDGLGLQVSDFAGATAAAHSIVVILHHVIRTGQGFMDMGQHYFEQRERPAIARQLMHRLERLGLKIAVQAS